MAETEKKKGMAVRSKFRPLTFRLRQQVLAAAPLLGGD